MPESSKIDIICGNCGGNNVSRDAWANWDARVQQWVLGAVFDYGHCHDCDGRADWKKSRCRQTSPDPSPQT